ncbi:pantothenate kinase, partial [Helicobacter pylori]|nr:pantothenate kinase [Helicobacter pylori]MCQ2923309.1 pantothenate kinase [Helicobacter pylori]
TAGGYIGSEIGDRVEDYIRGVDREPQAPREPTYDRHFVYDR